jgi:hypothetical protein
LGVAQLGLISPVFLEVFPLRHSFTRVLRCDLV